MASITSCLCSSPVVYGRSGYNKDGDDDKCRSQGRSGYNDPNGDGAGRNQGRSGYNKGDDDDK